MPVYTSNCFIFVTATVFDEKFVSGIGYKQILSGYLPVSWYEY